MTLHCPYCERRLTGTDLDTQMCDCGALFEEDLEAELLRFEGGETVDIARPAGNHRGFSGP